MEDQDKPQCSQSFFVSQRKKSSKLSLKVNNLNQPNIYSRKPARHVRAKSIIGGRGQAVSASKSRRGGKESQFSTLEKYLGGGAKETSACIQLACENDEPSSVVSEVIQSHGDTTPSSVTYSEHGASEIDEYSPSPPLALSVDVSESHLDDNSGESKLAGSCNLKSDVQADGGPTQSDKKFTLGSGHKNDLNVAKIDRSGILMCPLCWKSFDCVSSQTSHMKLCAIKHKVSTKQLLESLELIQRQEAERQALGLPLLAIKIPTKHKKGSSHLPSWTKTVPDNNLQLGLALSVSLSEAEKEKERDHLLEAGLFVEAEEKGLLPTQEILENFPVKPAPIFLNARKRSGDEIKDIPKVRRKNFKYGLGGKASALLRRTAEDRERLITEKVAIILVGDDNGISARCVFSSDKGRLFTAWELQSKDMKKYVAKENIWWTLASLSPQSASLNQYYVASLSESISPSKVVAGAKLKNLSQIPGRNNTPVKTATRINKDKDEIAGQESLIVCNPEVDHMIKLSSENPTAKRNLFFQGMSEYGPRTLSRDWKLLIGRSEMSDITIYTKEDHEILAHKLVFYVRCPNILKDTIKEESRGGSSSEMIIWSETCLSAALEFLKFVYTGELSEALEENVMEGTKELAGKYQLTELLRILDSTNSLSVRHKNILVNKNDTSSCLGTSPNFIPSNHSSPHLKSVGYQRDACILSIASSENITALFNEKKNAEIGSSVETEHYVNTEDDRKYFLREGIQRNSFSPSMVVSTGNSPDIFHTSSVNLDGSPKGINVVEDYGSSKNCDSINSSQGSRSSIEYLVSLMDKDSECSGSHLDSQKSQESGHDVPEKVRESPCHAETVNLLNRSASCSNVIECTELKTPSKRRSNELVYPTPASGAKMLSEEIDELKIPNETHLCNDAKRKFGASDGSESSFPITKKICILDTTVDSEPNNFKDTSEKEVVDLTLSSSESEETPDKPTFNNANFSTLPGNESYLERLRKEEDVLDDKIPSETSYISNVWDDFDHISNAVFVTHDKPTVDVDSNSPNPLESNENSTDAFIPGGGIERSSQKMNSHEMDDVLKNSLEANVDENHSHIKEKELNQPSCIQAEMDKVYHDSSDITDKLLSDSLQRINDSIFWKDENEPVEGNYVNRDTEHRTPVRGHFTEPCLRIDTPINISALKSVKKDNVTPIADFSAMKTPLLHKELDRYGIKHLKRNQAKKILRHIYNELHPVVSNSEECVGRSSCTTDNKESVIQKSVDKHNGSQPKGPHNKIETNFEIIYSGSEELSSSEESSGSSSESVILEESICEQIESPLKDSAPSQKACSVDIPTGMKIIIERNPTLHRKILLYEPVWLNEIKLALKEIGAKFNVNHLMDYLDEKCITFRLASGNRHRRKRAPRKNTISLSQPCSDRTKKNAAVSSSQPF